MPLIQQRQGIVLPLEPLRIRLLVLERIKMRAPRLLDPPPAGRVFDPRVVAQNRVEIALVQAFAEKAVLVKDVPLFGAGGLGDGRLDGLGDC